MFSRRHIREYILAKNLKGAGLLKQNFAPFKKKTNKQKTKRKKIYFLYKSEEI